MGLFFSSWRNDVLTEAAKIGDALGPREPGAEDSRVKDVQDHIDAAQNAAAAKRGFTRIFAAWSGADIEAAWAELHAAKQALIFVAQKDELRARVPELRSKVRRYLAKSDPSRVAYEKWLTSATTSADDKLQRAQLHEIRVNVDWESDRKFKGIRRFRNLLLASSLAVALASAGAAVADESFDFLPLCPPPTEVAPAASTGDATTTETGQETTPTDAATEADTAESCPQALPVVGLGAFAGMFAAVAAIRNRRAQTGPYALSVSQGVLKVPMGAASALIGMILLQSGLVDALKGVSAPEAYAYVIVFGFAQELVTRLIDKKADSIAAGTATSTAEADETDDA